MKVARETLYIARVFYYTTIFYLMSRFAPYIPSAIAGGFTALLGKVKYSVHSECTKKSH
jgi:hypothetical protein